MILSSKLSIETISANPRSFIILMVAVYISYFLFCFTSCNDGNGKSFPDTINDVELNGDHILDNRPLKVFVHSKEIDFGFCTNPSNAFVTINHMKNLLYEIGNRCEEQFGYPVEFISNPLSDNEKNEYLTYLDSGLSFDLLFPSKIPPNQFNNIESFKFFNDEFIEKQYYMNLSPYINDYCPDVYANMLDFNEVTDLYKKGDEIYALYAGVPDVSHMALIIKNQLKEEFNVQSIENVDMLFNLTERINNDKELENTIKVAVSPDQLLMVATIKAGYYPITVNLWNRLNHFHIVFKLNDENCKPYLIEDTDIFDVYLEIFDSFFRKSYFVEPSQSVIMSRYSDNELPMWLSSNFFSEVTAGFLYSKNNEEHFMNHYSAVMLDAKTTAFCNANSVQPIFVPYTCTQPEKALSFVNWLFTDEEIAALLTFGTDKGPLPGYQFSEDQNMTYNKDGHTIYMFHHLIANFSDRLFPYDNRTFDMTGQYKNLAKKAIYPPLFKVIESNHGEAVSDFLSMTNSQNRNLQKRAEYMQTVLSNMISNPDSYVTSDEIKRDLSEMIDRDELIEIYQKYIRDMMG